MGDLNWICGDVVGSQLQWLMERSKNADDVPWWCHGCTIWGHSLVWMSILSFVNTEDFF